MSATLTWNISGNGVKTGTAIADYINNLETLIGTKAGDATFFWEVAGKNVAATPYWLLLRRKDASAGRIAILHYTSAPAAVQPVLFDQTPSTTYNFIAWFPSGTGTTLSNLTAATGTVCGDDTGAVKASTLGALSSHYGALYVPFYVDCKEGMCFGAANPAVAATGMFGAGDLLVDAADVAYGCTFGMGEVSTFGSSAGNVLPWQIAPLNSGQTQPTIKTNYGSANRNYWTAWKVTGAFGASAVGANDLLSDSGANKRWYIAVQLLGQTKGEGFVLKFRQFGYGSGSVGPFDKLYTTGPVLKAMQFCNQTSGGNGFPWFLNFKI